MYGTKVLAAASVISAFALAGLTVSGCQRPTGEQKESGAQSILMVKGSDTMVHLVSIWAEEFMNQTPGIEVAVTGGGSGTGIAALLNGTADICASSRTIKADELEFARQRGIAANEIVVAQDGLAVVVHPANPLNEITMEQLEKVFTGAITNWNQLGGPDQKIVVLSRESSSGTYVFFLEHVLQKKDYTSEARLMPATSSIIQTISADNWAIGYVGLGYAAEAGSQVKILAVKAGENAPAILPSEETVKSGEYAIARPLHLYTNGEPAGTVKQFVEFSLSARGQEIVRETGYITAR